MSDERDKVCGECGQPVRKVAESTKTYGKGATGSGWIHDLTRADGPVCHSQFPDAVDIMGPDGTEVPVQN